MIDHIISILIVFAVAFLLGFLDEKDFQKRMKKDINDYRRAGISEEKP